MLSNERFWRFWIYFLGVCLLVPGAETQSAIVLNMALRTVEGPGGNNSFETFLGFQSAFDPQVQIRMPDGEVYSGGVNRSHSSLAALQAATIGRWQVTTPTKSGAFTLGSFSAANFPAQPRVRNSDPVSSSFILDLNSEDFSDAGEPAVLVDDISNTIDTSFLFSIYGDGDSVDVPLLPGETMGSFNLFSIGTERQNPSQFLSSLTGDMDMLSSHQVSFQAISPSRRLTVNAVPEPSALAFCMIITGLATHRRRQS